MRLLLHPLGDLARDGALRKLVAEPYFKFAIVDRPLTITTRYIELAPFRVPCGARKSRRRKEKAQLADLIEPRFEKMERVDRKRVRRDRKNAFRRDLRVRSV